MPNREVVKEKPFVIPKGFFSIHCFNLRLIWSEIILFCRILPNLEMIHTFVCWKSPCQPNQYSFFATAIWFGSGSVFGLRVSYAQRPARFAVAFEIYIRLSRPRNRIAELRRNCIANTFLRRKDTGCKQRTRIYYKFYHFPHKHINQSAQRDCRTERSVENCWNFMFDCKLF